MGYHDEYALMMYNEQMENALMIIKEKKMNETIEFNELKLAEFKIAFDEAKKRKEHYFMFDGKEFFIGYAKYAIEYLENEFNAKKENND